MNLKLILCDKTKSPSREGILLFEEKETAKTMSKGGYIRIYFGFCWVVVGGGYILAGSGWWWMVVGGGEYVLAGGG